MLIQAGIAKARTLILVSQGLGCCQKAGSKLPGYLPPDYLGILFFYKYDYRLQLQSHISKLRSHVSHSKSPDRRRQMRM